MRKIILLAALAVAASAWAQDQKKEQAKPAAAAEEKTKPAAAVAKRSSPSKRGQDARHCLEKASNTEIIKCAEAYL
jgi:hypothetical protein